tara:strand:- start:560 stop:811 length:252 start_codon:yes stop_codon:yes gene_type:complete
MLSTTSFLSIHSFDPSSDFVKKMYVPAFLILTIPVHSQEKLSFGKLGVIFLKLLGFGKIISLIGALKDGVIPLVTYPSPVGPF